MVVLCAALLAAFAGAHFQSQHWLFFGGYLLAVLLSSGMKVCLLGSDSTMSANFPILLLAVVQLSPLQVMGLAAISVFAQCKFRVQKLFSLVQIGFNIANAVNAVAACSFTYAGLTHLHLAAAPALASGAIAYFFVTTVPTALIIAWTSEKAALPLWRGNFAWFLPFYLVGAALAMLAFFLGTHYGLATALLELPAAYTIYRAYNAQIDRIRDREQHQAEMEALHVRTIESLAMAIEAKDHDTHDHLLRVRVYVTELGNALQLSEAEMRAVKTAALLHDIGKLAVPERILNKPGKLTPEEFEVMKIHPVVGADILERVRFPYPVVPIVRAHHEWWNGMGYPDGLSGEAIPIGARILTAVDSFDAMASDRSYRRAMPLPEAMAVIRKLSGTQFDPRVVDALEQRYVGLEEQARREGEKLVRLNTDVYVSRGAAPGAGFEQAGGEAGGPVPAVQRSSGKGRNSPETLQSFFLVAAVAERMQALLRKTESVHYELDLEETLAVLASGLASLIPCFCVLFYLKEGNELSPRGLGGHTGFFSPAKIPLGEGISGWVAKHEQSIVNGNATVEANYIPRRKPEDDLHSALSLPLRDLDGVVFGVLSLYAGPANAFSRDQLRALEAVETTIMQALKNSMRLLLPPNARVSLSADAFVSIEAAIEQCLAGNEAFALLLCGFKPASGPLPAARSRNGVFHPRESDADELLMHWGSMWLLLLRGAGREQAARRAAAIRDAADPEGRAALPMGVGIACFPGDGQTAQTLIVRAERHMRQDRNRGNLPVLAGAV